MQDILRLYLFALVVHMFIMIPYDIMADHRHETVHGAVHKVLNIIIYAAPPGLPSLMISNGIIATMRLAREGLTLIYPAYLQYTADLDMVCFDKTGTLTHRNVSPTHCPCCACLLYQGRTCTTLVASEAALAWPLTCQACTRCIINVSTDTLQECRMAVLGACNWCPLFV